MLIVIYICLLSIALYFFIGYLIQGIKDYKKKKATEREKLEKEVYKAKLDWQLAEIRFDYVNLKDTEMLDCAIYDIKSKRDKYNTLLKKLKGVTV